MKRTLNKKALLIVAAVPIFLGLCWLVGSIGIKFTGDNGIYLYSKFWDTGINGFLLIAVTVMAICIVGIIICGGLLLFDWVFPKKEKSGSGLS